MEKKEYNDMAIIFRAKDHGKGNFEYIPVNVKIGHLNAEQGIFIDNEGLAYDHIIERPGTYGFFDCNSIDMFMKDYQKIPLPLLRKIILSKYKSFTYQYTYELTTDAPIILAKSKKNNIKVKALMDNYILAIYVSEYPDYLTDVLKLDAKIIANLEEEKEDTSLIEQEENNAIAPIDIDVQKLYNEITSRVVGQNEQIKKILIAIWKQYSSSSYASSRNILVNGKTASGKTMIFRAISELINVPCVTVDATQYTASGYIGRSVDEMLYKLLVRANGDIKKAERGILIIDEIDKLANNNSNTSTINTIDVQEELLKILEDGSYTLTYKGEDIEFDTSHLLVIAGGSFSHINIEDEKTVGFISERKNKEYQSLSKNDFATNGLIPEFLGRFPISISLRELDIEDFINILKNPYGILSQNISFFKEQGVELIVTDEALHAIATLAIKEKFGARALDEIIEKVLTYPSFEIAMHPNTYEKLIISEKTVYQNTDYELIKAHPKTLTKKLPKQIATQSVK